ncbi:ThuA domain-containing protein [Enterococcus sp.]|uniref:ThuA domain-containing protein n=1 Tax=Enterococcus sp. TaxID=35783 RepID=UPI003C7934AA
MANIWIVRDDYYHPKEVVDPFFAQIFENSGHQVHWRDNLKTVIAANETVDLLILCSTGRNDGQEDVTHEDKEIIAEMVSKGMGLLFFHSGCVLVDKADAFYQKLNSGRFVAHSDGHVQVRTTPIRNIKEHPILKGVQEISGLDEHYFCEVEADKIDALMISSSKDVSSLGCWCSQYGLGRTVVSLPGHTPEILTNQNLVQLIKNAVVWCLVKE